MLKLDSHPAGRHFLHIPGPSPVPDGILRAVSYPTIDHRGPEFAALGLAVLDGIKKIFQTLRELNQDHGVTILLIEQNAHHALRVAHRGYVLQHGQIVMTGSGRDLLASAEVRAAYLEGGQGEVMQVAAAHSLALGFFPRWIAQLRNEGLNIIAAELYLPVKGNPDIEELGLFSSLTFLGQAHHE